MNKNLFTHMPVSVLRFIALQLLLQLFNVSSTTLVLGDTVTCKQLAHSCYQLVHTRAHVSSSVI